MDAREARASKERGLLAFVALAALGLSTLGCMSGKRAYPEDALDEVDSISGGGNVACAHRRDGTWCWGESELVPRPNGYAQPIAIPHVARLAAGAQQTCVLFDDRTVACTEAAHPMFDPSWPAGPAITAERRLWRVPGLERIEHIGVGRLIDCARRADGLLFCWGNNASGGVAEVTGIPTIAQVSVGDDTAFAVGNDGSAWVVGGEGSPAPWRVPGVADAVEGASGRNFHCLRRRDGTVSCFRVELAARAAFGAVRRTLLPVKGVEGATQIAAGGDSACAIVPNGATCWGNDSVLSRNESVSWVDASIVVPGGIALAMGAHHVCTLDAQHHVYCRGEGAAVGAQGLGHGVHENYVTSGAARAAEQRRAAFVCNVAAAVAALVAAVVAWRVLARASWPGAPVTAGAGYRASALPTTGAPPPRIVGAALYLGLIAAAADAGVLVAAVVARADFLFMVFLAVAIVLGLLFVAARLLVGGARGSAKALEAWVIVGVFGFVGHASLLFAQFGADGAAALTPAIVVVSIFGLVASLVIVRAARTKARLP